MNHVRPPGASAKNKESVVIDSLTARLTLAGLGIRVTVTGNRGDVGMERPFFQDALPEESSLFEHPGRGSVLNVANRPDSENGRIAEGPASHSRDRFGHKAAAPVRASQQVSEIDSILVFPRGDAAGRGPRFPEQK